MTDYRLDDSAHHSYPLNNKSGDNATLASNNMNLYQKNFNSDQDYEVEHTFESNNTLSKALNNKQSDRIVNKPVEDRPIDNEPQKTEGSDDHGQGKYYLPDGVQENTKLNASNKEGKKLMRFKKPTYLDATDESSLQRNIFSTEEEPIDENKSSVVELGSGKKEDPRLLEIRVREQNRKLKQQLQQLAETTDALIKKQKQARVKVAPNSELLKEKTAELKDQLVKIDYLKNEIAIMKRQMDNTYNLPKVIEREDALRAAIKYLEKVIEEKESLINIKRKQNEALDFLNNEGAYDERLNKVNEELRQVKAAIRKETEIANDNERAMKKLHEKFRKLDAKVYDLKNKLKYKKKDKTLPQKEATEEDIKELEEKIAELITQKEQLEKVYVDERKLLEKKKKALSEESAKLQEIVKEKEKEIRLNNLRLKEMKKLTRHNALKPLNIEGKKGPLSIGSLQNVNGDSSKAEDENNSREKTPV